MVESSTFSVGNPKVQHSSGVFEAPAAAGWVRLVAVGQDGKTVAISEFQEGLFDVQTETRRLLSRIEHDAGFTISTPVADKPRIALVR